jgi:saccharopine dehydrogenase-like NADP-dependent oxidoreductase
MKEKILVLGAGLVSRPLVRYLLERNFEVIVASRTLSKAERVIDAHPKGKAERFDITKEPQRLETLIPESSLVVSLLPYVYHLEVAKACIRYKRPLVTTSYVKEEMKRLHDQAKEAGIIILNEIGLDPGIDHMSAMEIIDGVHNLKGKIKSFRSYCGALPSPEASTNPFKYKMSWSPRGVLLASKSEARYLKDKTEVYISGKDLFNSFWHVTIEGLGKFEVYPNRDSLSYIELYNIPETETMIRGTIRNLSWCETLKKIEELGLLEERQMDDLYGTTYKAFMARLIKSPKPIELKKELALYLKIPEDSEVLHKLEWLGLLGEEKIKIKQGSPLDVLCELMIEKLKYEKGERDMILLYHEFLVEYPDKKERITSCLIDYGIPDGDSAVSRTVSLPAAIASRLILEGRIDLSGVFIPTFPQIYKPVLKDLEGLGIKFTEKRETI